MHEMIEMDQVRRKLAFQAEQPSGRIVQAVPRVFHPFEFAMALA
jgi:hypothetical protein